MVRPRDVDAFLAPLPVAEIPGVGKVMNGKLAELGVVTVGELRALALPALEARFGRYGRRLYELARGVDDHPVVPDRPVMSVSAEDTFSSDVPLADTEAAIRRLAEKTWAAACKTPRVPRTVVLKLKTSDFRILTRSHTPAHPPASCTELTDIALALRDKLPLSEAIRYRLVGVGLSNFGEPDGAASTAAQPDLLAAL